jgi:hypothetical protein
MPVEPLGHGSCDDGAPGRGKTGIDCSIERLNDRRVEPGGDGNTHVDTVSWRVRNVYGFENREGTIRTGRVVVFASEEWNMTANHYPEDSQATVALVLGILGLVLCQVLAPFAWSIGNTEVNAIDAGKRNPANRSTAQAGKILGIIGTVFLIIGVAVLLFFLVIALFAAAS